MTDQLSISDLKNPDLMRRRLNTLLALYAPGYGPTLPDVDDVPDGKIFYEGGIGYQKRDGAWEAL